MKEASFEVGDRVRHKVTQIEAEIVQLEESLAMPHAWVIEPSDCEFNPPRLYRYVDLEKVEPLGDRQTVSEELLKNISDITVCDQLNISKRNSSTLNKSSGDRLLASKKSLLEDKDVHSPCQPLGDKQTLTEELLEDISDITVCNKLDLSSGNSSTLNDSGQDPLSSSNSSTLNDSPENFLSSSNSLTLNKPSGDLRASNHVLLANKREVPSSSNDLTSNQLLEDNGKVPSPRNDSTSNQLLANKSHQQVSESSRQRRVKGDGSGCIYWRTVVRNGKEYQQAYYQYEFWQDSHCLVKSTKYIAKKLLKQVQQMNQAKVPVLEILEVLGVFGK